MTAQTYLKNHNPFDDQIEGILKFTPTETGADVLSSTTTNPRQLFSYSIDHDGVINSPLEMGDIISGLSFRGIIRNDTGIQAMTFNRTSNTLHALDISNSGRVLKEHSFIPFAFSDILIESFSRGDSHFLLSGSYRVEQEAFKGFVLWLDEDFEVVNTYQSTTEYNSIYSVIEGEDGETYGLVNFVDFDFTTAVYIHDYGRHYVARIDSTAGIDTIFHIQEGSNDMTFGQPPQIIVDVNGNLVFPYHKSTESTIKSPQIVCVTTDGSLVYEINSLDIVHNSPDATSVYTLSDGSVISRVVASVRTDATKNTSIYNAVISRIKDGQLLWSR